MALHGADMGLGQLAGAEASFGEARQGLDHGQIGKRGHHSTTLGTVKNPMAGSGAAAGVGAGGTGTGAGATADTGARAGAGAGAGAAERGATEATCVLGRCRSSGYMDASNHFLR